MIRSAAGGSGGERSPPGDSKGKEKVVVPRNQIKKPKISRDIVKKRSLEKLVWQYKQQ
jgi:hypothetical protein